MEDVSKVVTVEQAAEILHAATVTVRYWIARGRFPGAYKLDPLGRTSPFRIPMEDIEAFQARRQQPVGKNSSDA